MAFNCIIIQLADGFTIPATYGAQTPNGAESQDGKYLIIEKADDCDAAEIGYTPGMAYDLYITDHCPDAPDATETEIKTLLNDSGPNKFYPVVTFP